MKRANRATLHAHKQEVMSRALPVSTVVVRLLLFGILNGGQCDVSIGQEALITTHCTIWLLSTQLVHKLVHS